MSLYDTFFTIITSEHIVLQALVPMFFLGVLTLLLVGKQLRDLSLSLCIFSTIVLCFILFQQEIRTFCILNDIEIPFVHHAGNIDEFSLFICAIISLILALMIKCFILWCSRFAASRIADFEGEWHYYDDMGEKKRLIIEVSPHDIKLTPTPECLRWLVDSDGKRNYTFRHEKKTLSLCDELAAFELLRFTLWGRMLKASASDGTWTVSLKKRRHQKITDISDGSTLADWFLDHPDFSPELFLRNDESTWLEYKAGIRKTGHNELQNKSDEWRVAQGLLSMANTEGGLLVLGVGEQKQGARVFLELDPAYNCPPLSDKEAAEEFIRKKLLPWILPASGTWLSKASHKAFFLCTEDRADYELWRAELRIRRIRGTDAFLFFVPASPRPLRLIQTQIFDEKESWANWAQKEKNVPRVVLPIRQGSGAQVTRLEGASMMKAMLRPRTNSTLASFRALSLKLNVLLSEKE